jgi:uncharacterized protein
VTTVIRTCAGCGRKAPKEDLLRFTVRGGALEHGSGPGRGVYTCRRLACFERAAAHNAFARVLRKPVRVDPALSALYTEGRHG